MTPTIQAVIADFDIMLADHDPYVFGGISFYTGADCSGWLYESLVKQGVANPPRTSQAQYAAWKVAPGPGYGIAVFFDVPQDGPPQPQHVALCLGNGTIAEEPHTGLDAEIVPLPNIPGVESIMGYRYLPVSYGTTAPPATAASTTTAPTSIPQEVIMGLPTGCTDQQAVFAQIKEWWVTFRTDECSVAALDDLWVAWNLPTAQKGFEGSPFLLFSNIIDGVPGDPAPLRPQFVGAV